jgi:hypothetical protein
MVLSGFSDKFVIGALDLQANNIKGRATAIIIYSYSKLFKKKI